MKIVRASAGSGKTYTLAHHYIDLLLKSEDRYAYRHVLAVTFTNKATAEMKARILKDLLSMSEKEPKAQRILTDILHDYSAFAISTIDRFFQQTLKSFAREIGQFADYQVELDKESLIQEAMDRLLDGVTPDNRALVDWLSSSVMRKVEQGERFRLEEELYEIGGRLKSAEYCKLLQEWGIDENEHWSRERLKKIRNNCGQIIRRFEKEAERFGLKAGTSGALKYPGVRALKKDPDMASFFEEGYPLYSTAATLDKIVYSLGLAGEFGREYRSLLEEKNVMPLDDSNDILKQIIDGSDAPFVYEKTGIRYEHFLLDEFQDTSAIQWDNFLPLLKESEAGGGKSLIVGDVKQSIYRWRNSDWKLLGEQVCKDFPRAQTQTLESNWRSCSTIVKFNNDFFSFAASRLGASGIYGDVRQNVKSDDTQCGSVRISFTDDQTEAVRASIKEAVEAGAGYGDIAVLVRGHKDGGLVAEALISAGIPVISDDSLSLKSSVMVRRLCSLLSVMNDPEDATGGFLAKSFNLTFPLCHHSLTDLCEGLLRQLRDFDPKSFEGETLFIQAFMDILQSWVSLNGNNLRLFLKQWEGMDPVIGSPQDPEAVRIITIHKSKGLEFPYVIFPFADKVGGYKAVNRWCHLKTSGTGLEDEVEGLYPVELTKATGNTYFSEAYEEESGMQAIDNLNIFYVALTRAKQGLHVIAKQPSAKCRNSLAKGKNLCEFGNMSELLYAWCNGLDESTLGQMYDFTGLVREAAPDEGFPSAYVSYEAGDRLKASDDAMDFFGEDGVVGASARLDGIRQHAILSHAQSPDDLPSDMDPEARSLLFERMKAHPQWFSPDTCSRNELEIFDTDGKAHRPDRVVFKDGKVSIIDYKFGAPRESYAKQVSRYMNLYLQMGYTDVEGFVWYVPEDKAERVKIDADSLYL